ncbi:MAG: Multidrug transporter MdfA [Pseudomonadota bacterium]|jgi:DHA1 family multidrug/chloramphenicol efflux transport protein-like MFS transporter
MSLTYNKNNGFWFLLSLILYELPLYFSNNLFLPALPQIQQDFAVSNGTAQLSIAIWFLGASTCQVILGPLSDHYGRKKILLLGGLLFLIATAICSVTASITWFLVARFLQGCVVSTILIAGYATIHERLDRAQAIETISWMGSITVMAPAIGPIVGSLLIHWMSWRWLFVGLIAWTAVSLYLLQVFMPADPFQAKRLNLRKIQRDYRKVITNVNFWRYTLAFCALFAGLMAWDTLSPFYLMGYLKFSVLQFGLLQALVYIFFILGIRLQTISVCPLKQLILGGLIFAGIYFIFSFVALLYLPEFLIGVMGCVLFFSASTGLIFYSLHRTAVEIPKAPMGTTIAVFSTAMNLFGFLGSLAARAIYF